jgi:hypothetical protein
VGWSDDDIRGVVISGAAGRRDYSRVATYLGRPGVPPSRWAAGGFFFSGFPAPRPSPARVGRAGHSGRVFSLSRPGGWAAPTPDIGNPGLPLPAIVASVGGVSPDYSGMVLLVHLPNGTVVPRSAGFTSGQPLLSQATWATQGSNPLQARWALMDALA